MTDNTRVAAKAGRRAPAARFDALQGVTVLDLSKVLAGPICAQYLGDLGAEVIKIEPVGVGDDTRSWPPFVAGESAIFLSVNKNKRSIALDLKRPEGLAVLHRMVAQSDVVIESYRTGVAARLGIDYETLRKLQPRLVHASISGFGRSGPLAEIPGYDAMVQAFSGIMSITGEKGGSPVRIPISPLDQTTGIHTALGIVAALRRRDLTGEGTAIETSLYETALGFLGYVAQTYWATGKAPEPAGSGHESLCPYQAFAAADGQILIAVGSDKVWRAFAPAVGLEAVRDDPRFATNQARVAHFDETVGMVAEVIARRSVAEWCDILRQAGVPHSPINTVDASLDQPQARERGMVTRIAHSAAGEMPAIAIPILFAGCERSPRSAAPTLGEHSAEILRRFQLSDEEVSTLVAAGVVGTEQKGTGD
ncbi:CoA transferase [Aquibium sp. LZ166]|uniref:CoA transferase n=1 Tax=Aquibium pacificus TaxID=3153579 RepID=A0ABV3SRP7_9HYPH